ncbi:DUF1178 family protein [Sphingomonas faeni]|uniref:DUF1178 family protein n=1 Tax=Sphingomonas faeni TaxID=185950 RepID=UPI00334734B2
MIVFDLKCSGGHVFEAWFASSGAYEEQRTSGQITCPICDDAAVIKAVMAPAIPSKGNRKPDSPTPAAVKSIMKALATRQAEALKSSEWVGTAFADRARAMHFGEEDHATIHGQASLAEAKALIEDGIPVAPLVLPVAPPKKLN